MNVGFVELTDGDIVVRPYRAEDIPLVYESARESLPQISRWMPWCHPNYSIAETKTFVLSRPECWQSDAEYGFGIFRPNARHLGGVGLNFINRIHQMANLGYWVRSSETGQGIASRATRLVARFAVEQLGLQRIEILAATGKRAQPARRGKSRSR